MRRIIAAVAVVLVAAATVPGPAAADPPQPPPPLTFTPYVDGMWHIFTSVEQQPDGVVNPDYTPPATHCLWDLDDWTAYSDNGGQLAGYGVAGYDECLYADAKHLVGVDIQSSSPDLDVTVTFTSAAETRTFRVARTGTVAPYRWRACMSTPGIQQAGPLPQPIPDSNGGEAVVTTIQFRVTNLSATAIVPTGKPHSPYVYGSMKVRNWGVMGFHTGSGALCATPNWPIDLTNYPQVGTDPAYRLGAGITEAL